MLGLCGQGEVSDVLVELGVAGSSVLAKKSPNPVGGLCREAAAE